MVGSMIMSKDAIVTASEMLLKEDFYHQQYLSLIHISAFAQGIVGKAVKLASSDEFNELKESALSLKAPR